VVLNFANVPATANAPNPVVPGRWTVTNTQNANGSTSSQLTFVPLYRLPASMGVKFTWGSALKSTNGTVIGAGSANYTTDNKFFGGAAGSYGRANTSQTETFTNTTYNDSTYTTALWGSDACSPGTLLMDQTPGGAAGTPTGGTGALNVLNGQTVV